MCLLECVAHIADDALRMESYPFSHELCAYDEDHFVDAIEREDEKAAIACMRGAIKEKTQFQDVERGLTRAALLHYNDFGHSIIYVSKAGTLIDMHAWHKLGINKALELTARFSATPAEQLYAALLGASAGNMLAYDLQQQNKVNIPISDNIGWLDFTHGVTFSRNSGRTFS